MLKNGANDGLHSIQARNLPNIDASPMVTYLSFRTRAFPRTGIARLDIVFGLAKCVEARSAKDKR